MVNNFFFVNFGQVHYRNDLDSIDRQKFLRTFVHFQFGSCKGCNRMNTNTYIRRSIVSVLTKKKMIKFIAAIFFSFNQKNKILLRIFSASNIFCKENFLQPLNQVQLKFEEFSTSIYQIRFSFSFCTFFSPKFIFTNFLLGKNSL